MTWGSLGTRVLTHPHIYIYVMLICICYNTWRMVMTDMDNDDCGNERQGGFLEYMDNN